MTVHNQPIPEEDYEQQEYDPNIEEFEGLINPFVNSKRDDQTDHLDRDFESKDPGWPYPDEDPEFNSQPIQSKIHEHYGHQEIEEDQDLY